MIYGIQAGGSVDLTEDARALDEQVSLKKTHERLSNNLSKTRILDVVSEQVLVAAPMRKSRKVLWWAVQASLSRWKVEETIRFIKQSYELPDIRGLGYDSIRNLAMLVFACFSFAAV